MQLCPSTQDLSLFVQQQLPDASSEQIRDHLDLCDSCRHSILAGLSVPTAPPPSALDADLAGSRLGPFELVRRVGAGGMGIVYEAIDQRLGRAVALKLVRGDQARLLDEARAMAGVRHPSVLTVFEAGELDGSVYLATELIRGTTLRDAAAGASRRTLLAMYRCAAEGLAAAHAHGLVHRDFKPDNVLVEHAATSAPRVLVADFGLATASEPGAPRTRAGTPVYMAPEQLDGAPLDARVDVFAFCVALWEALAGARPFAGDTLGELRAAMTSPPKLPRPRAIPPRLRALLVRGLAEDPAARPSLAVLAAALAPPRPARAIAGTSAALAVTAVAAAFAWPREPVVAAQCFATRTPAEVTTWGLARAPIPAWVRDRVTKQLAERDREVGALQRQVCTTGDDAARRAWIACRHDHAIEEAALVGSLAGLWPSYDRLDEALDLPWPSTCTSRAARIDAALVPVEPAERDKLTAAKTALANARFAALAGRDWKLDPDGPLRPETLLLEATREQPSDERLARVTRAVEIAEREAHVATAARAWLALARARFDAKADDTRGIDLALGQASWAIDRAGDPPMLRAAWHAMSATYAWRRTDLAGAEQHARAAAEIAGDNPHRKRIAVRALAAAAAARADFTAERSLLASLAPGLAGATDVDAAMFHRQYAICLYHLGELVPARREAELAVALMRGAVGDRDPLTAKALLARGFVELDENDAAGCERTVGEIIAILEVTVGRNHTTYGAALNLRSGARGAARDWAGALADSEAAAVIFERLQGPRAEQVIFAHTHIGELARMLGQRERARVAIERALADARAVYGPEDPRTADIERSLSSVFIETKRTDEARALLEHALAVQERAQIDPTYMAQTQADLARLTMDRALARRALAAWRGQAGWVEHAADLEKWLADSRAR